MKIVVRDETIKMFHAKNGYNKIFGMDVDERQKMSKEQLIQRFDNVWNNSLSREIMRAEKCNPKDAKRKLGENHKQYFEESQEHREFWVENGLFIAQLRQLPKTELELTQLWFIRSSDRDPRVLYIRFDTVAERDEFHKLARELHWADEELGKQLVLNFISVTRYKSFISQSAVPFNAHYEHHKDESVTVKSSDSFDHDSAEQNGY